MLIDALQIPAAVVLLVLAVRFPFKGRIAVGAVGLLLLVSSTSRLLSAYSEAYPAIRVATAMVIVGLGLSLVRLMSPEARRSGAPTVILSVGVILGIGALALMTEGQWPRSVRLVTAGGTAVMGVGAMLYFVRFVARDRVQSPR